MKYYDKEIRNKMINLGEYFCLIINVANRFDPVRHVAFVIAVFPCYWYIRIAPDFFIRHIRDIMVCTH